MEFEIEASDKAQRSVQGLERVALYGWGMHGCGQARGGANNR